MWEEANRQQSAAGATDPLVSPPLTPRFSEGSAVHATVVRVAADRGAAVPEPVKEAQRKCILCASSSFLLRLCAIYGMASIPNAAHSSREGP